MKWRWSLRTLGLVTILIALLIAGVINRARARQLVLEQLSQLKTYTVTKKYCLLGVVGVKMRDDSYPWLANLVGSSTNLVITRVEVYIHDSEEMKQVDQVLTNRTAFRGCESIVIHCVSDSTMETTKFQSPSLNLARLSSVRILVVEGASLSKVDFDLFAKMSQLEILALDGSEYSPADVSQLVSMQNLAWLTLSGNHVTVVQMEEIRSKLARTYVSFF